MDRQRDPGQDHHKERVMGGKGTRSGCEHDPLDAAKAKAGRDGDVSLLLRLQCTDSHTGKDVACSCCKNAALPIPPPDPVADGDTHPFPTTSWNNVLSLSSRLPRGSGSFIPFSPTMKTPANEATITEHEIMNVSIKCVCLTVEKGEDLSG